MVAREGPPYYFEPCIVVSKFPPQLSYGEIEVATEFRLVISGIGWEVDQCKLQPKFYAIRSAINNTSVVRTQECHVTLMPSNSRFQCTQMGGLFLTAFKPAEIKIFEYEPRQKLVYIPKSHCIWSGAIVKMKKKV